MSALRRVALVLAAALVAPAAVAQDYPSQPIKLLVGFGAGGLDTGCRLWAHKLSLRVGQPVVVENRPGASGELAMKQAIAAKPDGHTLICMSGSNPISSAKPNAPFDLRNEIAPVIQMNKFTFVLYVNATLPIRSVPDLVAYAKANPGKLNYASVGIGSTPHLSIELLKLQTGIDIVHVPFKGSSQTSAAILAGEVQVGLDAIAALKPHFEAGTLRPIGVVSAKRSPLLPALPGMQESGVPGVDIETFSGVGAPAGTPRTVVDLLNRHFNAILLEADVRAVFAAQGYEAVGGTPDDFRRMLAAEIDTWSRVIGAANVKFD